MEVLIVNSNFCFTDLELNALPPHYSKFGPTCFGPVRCCKLSFHHLVYWILTVANIWMYIYMYTPDYINPCCCEVSSVLLNYVLFGQ